MLWRLLCLVGFYFILIALHQRQIFSLLAEALSSSNQFFHVHIQREQQLLYVIFFAEHKNVNNKL